MYKKKEVIKLVLRTYRCTACGKTVTVDDSRGPDYNEQCRMNIIDPRFYGDNTLGPHKWVLVSRR